MEKSRVAELSGIGFSYNGTPLLEDVNLTIKKDDFIGVIGSNGSGKTTLLKLLLGHLAPQKGTVCYYGDGGETLRSVPIGYLPQYAAVDKRFPISVYELVETGLISPRTMFRPSLSSDERRQVTDTIERMRLSSLASRPICALSGGELQRAMLARAMVSRPRLLLLDEPNTYLDCESSSLLFELLKEINRNCAIVLVSHEADSVRANCNRVVVVNRTVECR